MKLKVANKHGKRNQGKGPENNGAAAASPRSKTIHRLRELATSIFAEAESLLLEQTLAELGVRSHRLEVSTGISFYDEVTRFEMDLIKLALQQAQGNQARAARLLGLGTTTLNWKIRQYGILA